METISITESNLQKDKRLKRQYKRLLSRWQTQAMEVSLPEVASVLVCTPRYARVLLNEMIVRKWLTWASRPGRGAKGRLQCRVNESRLNFLQHINQLQQAPTQNQSSDSNNNNRVVIPFYRPIESIVPSDNTGRVERHLILMVHAGLTRFNDQGVPEPDLAHTVESKNNNTLWVFHLRQNLTWHNGERVHSEQLLLSLQYHLSRPAFRHVSEAVLEGKTRLIMKLTRPDAMLSYRLANAVHVLSHPNREEIGLGAFSIRHHDDEHILLSRSLSYHGARPHLHEVEYRINACLPGYKWTTVKVMQSDDNPEVAEQVFKSDDSSGFVYLAFNERKGGIDQSQQAFIRALVRMVVKSMDGVEAMQSVKIELNPAAGKLESVPSVKLPAILSLMYYWSPEVELVMNKLARQLSYWQCRLVLRPVDANHWFLTSEWDKWDIGVSDMRFGKTWWFSPEERFCHSFMMQRFMPEAIFKKVTRIQERIDKNTTRYPGQLRKLMDFFLDKNFFMPLLSFKFQVKTTSNIKGVVVSSQGWPDLTRMRIEKK